MVKTSVITIRDVAKESGFSSTTVSIVLNNAPLARYIPPATKKRIEKAANKLGYRPNLFARSLRSKRSHTVGSDGLRHDRSLLHAHFARH